MAWRRSIRCPGLPLTLIRTTPAKFCPMLKTYLPATGSLRAIGRISLNATNRFRDGCLHLRANLLAADRRRLPEAIVKARPIPAASPYGHHIPRLGENRRTGLGRWSFQSAPLAITSPGAVGVFDLQVEPSDGFGAVMFSAEPPADIAAYQPSARTAPTALGPSGKQICQIVARNTRALIVRPPRRKYSSAAGRPLIKT